MELTSPLGKNWGKDQISAFLTTCKREEDKYSSRDNPTKQDSLHILATDIQKTNAANPSDFSLSTQLNVKELETYKQAMNKLPIQQWS